VSNISRVDFRGGLMLTAVRQSMEETHFFWSARACNRLTARAWSVAGAM
jgi:hypothetical protein